MRILRICWAERSARFQEQEVGSIEDNFLILLGNEESLIILGLLFLDQETFQRRPLRRTCQYGSHRGPANWFVLQVQSRCGIWAQPRETPAPAAAPRGRSELRSSTGGQARACGPCAQSGVAASLPRSPVRGGRTHRACRLLIRPSMSRCPAEYCSMTSFTSYGRRVSLNFLLATRNFRILSGEGFSEGRYSFPAPLYLFASSCSAPGHLLLGPLQTVSAGSPGLPTMLLSQDPLGLLGIFLSCAYIYSRISLGGKGSGLGCSLLDGTQGRHL